MQYLFRGFPIEGVVIGSSDGHALDAEAYLLDEGSVLSRRHAGPSQAAHALDHEQAISEWARLGTWYYTSY